MSVWAARVVLGPRGFLLRTRGSAPAAAPALSPAARRGAGNGDNRGRAVRGNPLSETPQNAPNRSHPEAGRKQSGSQEEKPDLGRDWERAESGCELGASVLCCVPPSVWGRSSDPSPFSPAPSPSSAAPVRCCLHWGGTEEFPAGVAGDCVQPG